MKSETITLHKLKHWLSKVLRDQETDQSLMIILSKEFFTYDAEYYYENKYSYISFISLVSKRIKI